MRKISSTPRIIRINKVSGYKIYFALNNGEYRIIDFAQLSEKLSFKKDRISTQIMDKKTFRTVSISNNTLCWKSVKKKIKLKSGKEFDVAFELDPIVIYDNSVPDEVRNERYKIGDLIKNQRIDAGLTQEQLAARCGTTRNYISRIENNRSDLELNTLRKIIEIGLGKQLELAIK